MNFAIYIVKVRLKMLIMTIKGLIIISIILFYLFFMIF